MQLPYALTRAGWPAAALTAFAAVAGDRLIDTQQRKWIFRPQKRNRWSQARALRRLTDMQEVWIGFDSKLTGQAVRLHGLWHPHADAQAPLLLYLHGAQHEVWIGFDSKLTGQAVRLHGLWHPHADAQAPLLLYLHGAQHEVSCSAERLRSLQRMGFSVLAVDYRGFGKSGGELPSETSAYEDAHAAWQWLAARQPGHARYIFGHSLGGAIAIHLASEVDDAAGLIIESSFTSLSDVVASFSLGWSAVRRFITQRFDAAQKIGAVRAPVLVVHGDDDRLIPHALGRALYDAAVSAKRFVLVPGGSHHDTHAVGEAPMRQALSELFGLPA
jgi:fermentation-respiration switch protein FrsA (DUF1100 family)